MRKTLRFVLNGKLEEIESCTPTETVLDYLRNKKCLTGTKEGCAEGDCGACTVVVAEAVDGKLEYSALNSCILFLPTLDGKQLITIEDLRNADGELHPVQQAMIDQHGSQCGFCTPGIVMSLFSAYHDNSENRTTRSFINKTLAGNLCRCTGYAPIVRAARQSLEPAGTDQFDQNTIPVVKILESLADGEMLGIQGGSGLFMAPTSTAEFSQCLEDHPQATIVAGATDVGLWVTKHLQSLGNLIYTGKVRELLEVKIDPQTKCLSIGAAVTYTQAMPEILEAYPNFEELLIRLGADQVRNAGTIGGNIANGSPIGDMPPALIALDAKLVLESSAGERILNLEDFFIDYGKQDLRDGEFVARILLPLPQSGQVFRTYKISKRTEQDISAVCAAFSILIVEGKVSDVRISFGGMAAIPKRANHCEQALLGQQWNEECVSTAMQELDNDFSPISDMRASAAYRISVARNLLKRFYFETSERPVQTRLSGNDEQNADVSV